MNGLLDGRRRILHVGTGDFLIAFRHIDLDRLVALFGIYVFVTEDQSFAHVGDEEGIRILARLDEAIAGFDLAVFRAAA